MSLKKVISAAVLGSALSFAAGSAIAADQSSERFALIDINKVAQFVTTSSTFKNQEETLSAEWKKISDARAELQKKAADFAKLTDAQRKTKANQAKQEDLTKANQAQLEKEKAFQDKYFQQKQASMKKLTDDVRAKVGEFAKKQGYSMVLNASEVWYPGTAKDITQDIIKQFKA